MCILFLYINDKEPKEGSFKLILAATRDEMYGRPTKKAGFWGSDPDIIGGRDMEPGREGGTWLALSKDGKIGALLNIFHGSEISSVGKKGRGFLVNDYLQSDKEGFHYLSGIHENTEMYMPYNLVTVDLLKNDGPTVSYYSNQLNTMPQTIVTDGIYSFGNSLIDTPWRKVMGGRDAFTDIVNSFNNTNCEDNLLKELIKMLRCKERYFPDIQLQSQGSDISKDLIQALSSRFVETSNYGSRTHTLIFVDNDNNASYYETTMEGLPNENHETKWHSSMHKFLLTR